MSGFFATFIMLVVAMAWAQWLSIRVWWAPRVVYVGGCIWLLALLFAGASFTTDDSIEAVAVSLDRIHLAAWVAQLAAIGTLVVDGAVSIYAFVRPTPSEPDAEAG